MRNNNYLFSLKFLILLFIIVLFSGNSEAQDPEWEIDLVSNSYGSAISGDGKYLVATEDGGMVYFYDVKNQTQLWSYDTESNRRLARLDISLHGEYMVVAEAEDSDDTARAWLFDKELTSDAPIWLYETEHNRFLDVAISVDGSTIALVGLWGGDNERLHVLGNDSETPIWTRYDSCSYYGASVAVSADGQYIVTKNHFCGERVSYHSIDSSTPIWTRTIAGDTDSCWDCGIHQAIDVSWDGKYVVASTYTKEYDNIALFDASESSSPLWIYQSSNSGGFRSVSITPDGSYISASHTEGNVYYFSKNSSNPIASWSGAGEQKSKISYDGKFIFSRKGSNAYLIDTAYSSTNFTVDVRCCEYNTLSFSLNGYYSAVSYSDKIRIYNNTGASNLPIVISSAHSERLYNPPKLSWFASSNNDSSLR
ncbi:hypothetical protein OAJ54_00875, partial [Marine Group III euryarchaeote]|nr:hypothetical protein [Marine Group III euryarchaeote]